MNAHGRWLRIGGTALAAAALLGLPGGGPVLGAAPPNDDLADAIVVAVPGSRTGHTTVGATVEVDEPGDSMAGIASTVWYRITTPTASGILVRLTPGTLDRPAMVVWRGPNLAALVEVEYGGEALWFAAGAGQPYLLQVGHMGGGGPGTFSLSVSPNNDRPSTTAPVASFPARRVNGDLIPVMVRWTPASAPSSEVYNSVVEHRIDDGPWLNYGVTGQTGTSRSCPSGHTIRFRVKVVDGLRRWSEWVESVDIHPRLYQERTSRAAWRGTWRQVTAASASGGSLLSTTSAGSRVSFVSTGRAVALIAPMQATRGRVKVYVNGTYMRTVDLAVLPRGASYGARMIAWQKTWSSVRTRTVTFVVMATPGRPRVDIDGFVILR